MCAVVCVCASCVCVCVRVSVPLYVCFPFYKVHDAGGRLEGVLLCACVCVVVCRTVVSACACV